MRIFVRKQTTGKFYDWKVMLKYILNKYDKDMGWTHLAQERDKWRSLLRAIMNLRVELSAG
jgi:hypothetical protein